MNTINRFFVLFFLLIISLIYSSVLPAQIDDVVVEIEKVEVREVSGDTIIIVVVNDYVGSEIDYPCAGTDAGRVLASRVPGLEPGSAWQMMHATLLAALSRGGDVRVRMGDCLEYMPGEMARGIVGISIFR